MRDMTNAIKMAAGGSVLAAILASCGVGSTGDGSASLYVSDVRTEYRDTSGTYVACDNVSNDGSISGQTAVATYFTLAGSINSAHVNLRRNTTSQYDNNYSTTFYPGDLTNSGANSYKATFYADSVTGGFLPQSVRAQGIVVNPNTTVYVKTVTTSGAAAGSFSSYVTVNSSTGQSAAAAAVRTIPVYSGCNIVASTNERL